MSKFKQFLRDKRGATALTFGLLLVPLMGMTGLALDYTVASNERVNLQNAADTAALAGASVFTGGNAQAAEDRARAFLRANLGAKASTVSVNFSAKDQKVTVNLGGQTNTLFMSLLNQNSVQIGVTSTALAPLKPSEAKIILKDMYGIWAKKVSIVVTRPGSTKEVTLGTVLYEAKDKTALNWRGTGVKTMSPADGNVVLGDYQTLYIKMEVKKDGCDVGRYNSTAGTNTVTCKTASSGYRNYDATYQTNDGNTVDHLFVDGVQLKKNGDTKLTDLLSCDKQSHEHAWEDGGGWDQQDLFYTVISGCKAVDGENVRLTN